MTEVRGAGGMALMERLVNKSGGVRSEATIQADVRMLLLDDELGLAEDDLDVQLETQVGRGRRIDVEVGCTVIEVKRSLASSTSVEQAAEQLAGYVQLRAAEKGQRYVGVITDGRLWIAYHEVEGVLAEATRHTAATGQAGGQELLRWLEGVLATKKGVRPTPGEISDRLGAQSSSHELDYSTLLALYRDSQDLPTVVLKRDLWASLLRSALGTQFSNSDELFLEHTLLVNSAEIIAHLVLGLDAEELSPATLLSGDRFAVAGLHGVVDRDFFDWVLEVPGGEGFVTSLARRLARFDWSEVEHDVLKVLYESVIKPETRKSLGEYYTPDWLARKIVEEVVIDPLDQRVLDPSCGSGTFVFYAVRRYLTAAEQAGVSLKDAMSMVSSRVMGIDLHPVAVALARVTYLLALGRHRLNAPDRGVLSVPVYLGDSLGWDQREDLMSLDQLVIPTEVGDQLLSGDLRFGDHLLKDAHVFDSLVDSLVDEAGRAAGKTTRQLSQGTIRRLALDEADLPDLNANFVRLKELHEAGRNHIWSYYIRNVSRPAWLARDENRVDVLVGNPPWLSYRHMTSTMQTRFKTLAQDRGFWHNETTATHQDLAGLFVARAVERYLRTGGRFGFVVPNSVVDRDYWGGFRRGAFDGANVAFAASWDLRRIRPHLFPRGSAVIFGSRVATAGPMPARAVIWRGRAPHPHAGAVATHGLTQEIGELAISSDDQPRSPYAKRFSQGANLVPRLFFRVEPAPVSALGVPSGRIAVQSKRSAYEKQPWKELPIHEGTVEDQFLWPTALGEQVIPFGTRKPETFVVPLTQDGRVLSGADERIDGYPGLAEWTRRAEAVWDEHGNGKMTLAEQIDHMSKLTQQMPVPPLRVGYAASGMHLSAAVLDDPRVIIEHAVYWCAVSTRVEGNYLVGVLNAPVLTELVRPFMSYGKDERHIDKHVWKLPIPAFDPEDELHQEISQVSAELAEEVATMTFSSDYFVTVRQLIRDHLVASERGRRLNELVAQLLDTDLDDATANKQTSDGPALLRTTDGGLELGADVEIDVDCEFDSEGVVYLWGVSVTESGSSPVYRSFGDTGPDLDEAAIATEFATWLDDLIQEASAAERSVRWYHYGRVERAHLERLVDADLVARLDQVRVDLLNDVIRPNHFAPRGYGLKQLASEVAGVEWRTPGATGRDTLGWIEAARLGDAEAWRRLVEYNEDDTCATRRLRAALTCSTPDDPDADRAEGPPGGTD